MKGIVKFILGAAAVVASPFAAMIPGAGGILAKALLTIGFGLMASAITPSVRRQAQLLDNHMDELAYLPVVYGKARIGVKIVDMRTAGDDNKYLYIVAALCHGSSDGNGIAGIDEIYFDDKLAVDASDVIQSPFSGAVLGYAKFLGTDSQSASGTMTGDFGTGDPVPWPSTSKGIGVAYIVFKLKYDTNVYTGIPRITAIVRGCKVYDPRVGGAFAYSTNPALCLYDYLTSTRYGGGVPSGEIDSAAFNADADYHDTTITVPNAYPTAGTTTVKRAEINGALDTGSTIEQNLMLLTASSRSNLVYQGGQFRVYTRKGSMSSSLTLDQSNIIGDWLFSLPGADGCPNFVEYEWVEPGDNYAGKTARWPEAGASNSYLTDDNSRESVRSSRYPLCTSRYVAMYMAIIELQEGRDGLAVQVNCTLAAMQVQIGDVVAVTHATPGWSAKLFWVTGLAFDPSGPSVRLSLMEYNSAAYTVATQSQAIPSPNTSLSLPTYTAPYPTLPPETGQDDGAEKRGLLKGYQSGTAMDGDTITFSPAYQNPPSSRVSGGKTYDSTLTSPVYEDKRLTNVSASGATVVAKLRSPGSPTTRTHDFTPTVLDTVNETEALTVSNAPASNDQYTVLAHIYLEIKAKYPGTPATISLQYAIESSSDSGGSWVTRSIQNASLTSLDTVSGDNLVEARSTAISVSGLDSTDKIRLRFIGSTITGAYSGSPLAEVRGANNGSYPGRGITYVTSTDTTVAATTTGKPVTWEAWSA